MIRIRTVVVASCIALVSAPIFACLWDYDTLAMERRQFPAALELITGKFLRHSKSFYQWRVEDRKKKVDGGSNDPKDYDDLSVAYEKVGDTKKAIEIAHKSNDKFPDRYETLANLGTFYIHDGQLAAGIEQIDKAIAINPNAHFGREIYQKLLVQYVLECQVGGKTVLPLSSSPNAEKYGAGFYSFLKQNHFKTDDYKKLQQETEKAIQGILGMMRFGNYDSPVLLEALGDLLAPGYVEPGAKRTATRAYLKASYEVDDPKVKQAYFRKAQSAIKMQTINENSSDQIKLSTVEATFKKEIEDAEAWYAKVKQDETNWVENGKNPEEEFAAKYYAEPVILENEPNGETPPLVFWLTVIGISLGVIGLGCTALILVRSRQSATT